MPEEAAGRLPARHLVVQLEISTSSEQAAGCYLFLETDGAARALGSEADDPDDQEQQTIVVASTILGQVLQALNAKVLGPTPAGLVAALDDVVANTGAALLSEVEDPGLWLTLTLARQRPLTAYLFIPGTALDIVANGWGTVRAASDASGAAAAFSVSQQEIDEAELIEESRQPSPPPKEPTPISSAVAQKAQFAPLAPPPATQQRQPLDLIADLQLEVTVELGRTSMTVAEVLGLGPGSIIELERIAGEPVDILVNDRLIARGEVVVVDENFGVRIVEVVKKGGERALEEAS
jgi:flagellar motor switch protein FliN